MSNNQAGKGSKPRSVKKEAFDKNFDSIKWTTIEKQPLVATTKKGKTTYKY